MGDFLMVEGGDGGLKIMRRERRMDNHEKRDER